MKLSDYRGKVVALVVGAIAAAAGRKCEAAGNSKTAWRQSFAIIGMYCDDHPEDATSLAKQSGMTWPSFKDARDGPIATAWNVKAWPSISVLDAKG